MQQWNKYIHVRESRREKKKSFYDFVIFTPLPPSRHPAGLLSVPAGGHKPAAGPGIPWSVDGSAAPPLLLTDPLSGGKRKLIINWGYRALFIDSKHFTLYPLFIHTTITLVVLSYICSHWCSGAH